MSGKGESAWPSPSVSVSVSVSVSPFLSPSVSLSLTWGRCNQPHRRRRAEEVRRRLRNLQPAEAGAVLLAEDLVVRHLLVRQDLRYRQDFEVRDGLPLQPLVDIEPVVLAHDKLDPTTRYAINM